MTQVQYQGFTIEYGTTTDNSIGMTYATATVKKELKLRGKRRRSTTVARFDRVGTDTTYVCCEAIEWIEHKIGMK